MKKSHALKKIKWSVLLFTGISIFSCTKEESLEEDILISSTSSFATPDTGNIYSIQSFESGRTLDIQGRSNLDGANLQLWGVNINTPPSHRQWEIIGTDSGYVRLRGVDSGKSLEVTDGSNSNEANVQQSAYVGTTHQQWEIISVGDGYFRLKNRDSGKSLTASGGTSNGSNVTQFSYNGSDNQKWFFTKLGESTESDLPSSEEVSDPVNEDEDDNSSSNDNSFITTNDGVFNLETYQIESSSHLSSPTDRKTTSWSYGSSDIDEIFGTEWYYVNNGDYYLKSASNDGKRTELKEDQGYESSLNSIKRLTYEASVDDIPEHGVTIGQVHNRGGVRRPYLRVYIEDGRIEVKETTNDLTNSSGTYYTAVGPRYIENSKFKVQITTVSGRVNVKVETSEGTLDEDFTPNKSVDGWSDYQNDFYLKAGVYTEGNDTEPEMRIYSFENL